MKIQFNKKKLTAAAYIILPLIFLLSIVGYEFYWRYHPLDLTIEAAIRDTNKSVKTIMLHEESDSPVDTVRREFKNIHSGKTTVYLWMDQGKKLVDSNKQQIITFPMNGTYISEMRPVHISSDSSTQLLLIPNTLQNTAAGSNAIVYIKNDSTFGLKYFSGFIADVDKDGNEEVNIPDSGWMKLNTRTGEWIPAGIKNQAFIP